MEANKSEKAEAINTNSKKHELRPRKTEIRNTTVAGKRNNVKHNKVSNTDVRTAETHEDCR